LRPVEIKKSAGEALVPQKPCDVCSVEGFHYIDQNWSERKGQREENSCWMESFHFRQNLPNAIAKRAIG
jgi:hypothetical protein